MLLAHLLGVVKRRWVLVVIGLVVTCGISAVAPRFVPTEYSLEATVILLPPVDSTAAGANPYLALSGLTGPTEVLARAMSDPAMEQDLRKQGATGTWVVDRDYLTSAPILTITAQGTSVETARATSDIILKEVPNALQGLQASVGVQNGSMITSAVVSKGADVQKVLKPLIRALLVILLAGALLTVGVASVVDSLFERRRRGLDSPAGEGSRRVPATAEEPVTGASAERTRDPARRRVAAGASTPPSSPGSNAPPVRVTPPGHDIDTAGHDSPPDHGGVPDLSYPRRPTADSVPSVGRSSRG